MIPMTDANLFAWYWLKSPAAALEFWARQHSQPVAKKGKR